jgi:vancomycin resistance protein VanJ
LPSPPIQPSLAAWWLRAAVVVSTAGLLLLTIAQQAGHRALWWLELSRYLPYPVLLAIGGVGLLCAARLGLRWVVASALALAGVAIFAMGFVWGHADAATSGTPLRLMTYNIKAYKAAVRAGGFEALAREVAAHRPDVLLVQDNQAVSRVHAARLWQGGRVFGFEHVFAVDQYIVASRYPLLDCGPHRTGEPAGRPYTLARCRVDVDGVMLSLVTTHFESPRTGLNAARLEGFDGLDDWRRNFAERLAQSRALSADLAGVVRPLVVAGDLNAPESSPVVGTLLRTGLRDAFGSAGRGYGYTYGHALRVGVSFLRIDHVLVSPEIGVTASFAGAADASDHRPVIADLLLPRR